MDRTIERIAKKIEDDLKASYSSMRNTLTAEDVKAWTERCLAVVAKNAVNNIDIHVESDGDRMHITAKNLYTLLLMHGFYVPMDVLGDKDEWDVGVGVLKCSYSSIDNKYSNTFAPKAPMIHFEGSSFQFNSDTNEKE